MNFTHSPALFNRLATHALRLRIDANGKADFAASDPIILALISKDAELAISRLSEGLLVIGKLLEHARNEASGQPLPISDVTALAMSLLTTGQLLKSLRRLSWMCKIGVAQSTVKV